MANLLHGGKGRPLHPMLVHFPVALYTTSLLFDGLSHAAGNGNDYVRGAFTLLVAGLVMSVLAALTGFADFLLIEAGSRSWRLALTHMSVMLVTTGLFLADAILRSRDLDVTQTQVGPLVLSLFGVAGVALGALLGGDLVFRHGRRVEAGPIVLDDHEEPAQGGLDERRAGT
jgi:uncharacterized membrane protein